MGITIVTLDKYLYHYHICAYLAVIEFSNFVRHGYHVRMWGSIEYHSSWNGLAVCVGGGVEIT